MDTHTERYICRVRGDLRGVRMNGGAVSTGRTRTGTDTLWSGRHATWNCSNASVYGSGSGHQPLRDDARGFSRPSVCERVCVCVCRCVWVPCLCCVCFMLNNCVHILFVGFFFCFVVMPNTHDDGRGVRGTGTTIVAYDVPIQWRNVRALPSQIYIHPLAKLQQIESKKRTHKKSQTACCCSSVCVCAW